MPSIQFKGKSIISSYHLTVPYRQLVPDESRSILAPEQPASLKGNLIVQGDNLHALKALMPSFSGKVKVIYIDPPYNTGNEQWVYNDNVGHPMLQEWLKKVVDKEDLTRHDKWLCMMTPRLKLLKELLREDGVIFVSIDDNEAHRLRLLMDEIFGEENFIAQLVWEKGRKNDAKLFSVGHEYLLCYANSMETLRSLKTVWREPKPGAKEIWEEYLRLRGHFEDDDVQIEASLQAWYQALPAKHPSKALSRYKHIDRNGPWRDRDISWPGGNGPRYKVIHPDTGKPCKVPERGWGFATSEKMQEQIELGLVEFRTDHSQPPFRKAHLRPIEAELEEDEVATIEDEEENGSDAVVGMQVMPSVLYKQSQVAVKYLRSLMNGKVFDNPKDHEVLARIIRYCTGTNSNDIILDSFAGSGTTGHAVLALNAEDGGNRRFILVEQEDYADTLTAERVRRVIKGVPDASDKTLKQGLGGSFTYCALGPNFDEETLLKGGLPVVRRDGALRLLHRHGRKTGREPDRGRTQLPGGEHALLGLPDLPARHRVPQEYAAQPRLRHATAARQRQTTVGDRLAQISGRRPYGRVPDRVLPVALGHLSLPGRLTPIQLHTRCRLAMQLKEYQQTTLNRLREYLKALTTERDKALKATALGINYKWDEAAWETIDPKQTYHARRSAVGDAVPNVCLKIPTGGGKTLLAVRAIDLINMQYRMAQTGLVLWIVPTTQIYNQTLAALRDRGHPYRVQLNMATSDRTLVLEKQAVFTPDDVKNNLVILLLMLPSANRQVKETLRIFKDRGGFESFFAREDDYEAHERLLKETRNLDTFDHGDGIGARTAKSSLGNTLRLLRPVIILDEGHKAYGELAQSTLLGFNPAFILELSATPPPQSNKLVRVTGQDLLREEMIKLDINVYNRASGDWKDTLLASMQHRDKLEEIAIDHEQSEGGSYIRPICLIQVERTGEKQRGAGLIHAEDVRDFLLKNGVLADRVAIKSSEKDEIEKIDLLSPDCSIRYIVTKHALQEGWDCPFAYILTVLTNPRQASTSITQLIGRVLRQPYARKTGKIELDESYVYCFRDAAGDVIRAVRAGLEEEGLGDLAGRVVSDSAGAQRARLFDPQPVRSPGRQRLSAMLCRARPG